MGENNISHCYNVEPSVLAAGGGAGAFDGQDSQ